MATLSHIVTKYDTLERLSQIYRVPICMILRANQGQRGLLRPGRRILIPFPNYCLDQARHREEIFEKKRYVVQRGDTLYGISKKFGTTMQKVLQENGLSRPEELKIGREITVSGGRFCSILIKIDGYAGRCCAEIWRERAGALAL